MTKFDYAVVEHFIPKINKRELISYGKWFGWRKPMERLILKNSAQCAKCGDIIESKNRHNFVTCSCGAISIDGGHWYIRCCGEPSLFIDLCESRELTEEEKNDNKLLTKHIEELEEWSC